MTALRRSDDGSAIVEFVWLGVLLLVPLTYLVLAAFQLQGAALGASTAAREAARAYATTAGDDAARWASADAAARLALRDQHVDVSTLPAGWLTHDLSCYDGGVLPTPVVHVDVRFHVSLPWLPHLVAAATHVGIRAHHDQGLDVYGAAGQVVSC